MSIDMKIIAMAEIVAEKHNDFERLNEIYTGKKSTLKNLISTRESLRNEACHHSDEWERSLLESGGIETDVSDKTTLLTGMAQQKLERINPLIERAEVDVLIALYDTAGAARDYASQHIQLCSSIIEPECQNLIATLRPVLEIAWALHRMTHLPEHNFDSLLSGVLGDIKKASDGQPAEQHLTAASGDALNPLSLFPGAIPSGMRDIMRRSPSAAQMTMARNNPEKMQALTSGREPCKGLGGGVL